MRQAPSSRAAHNTEPSGSTPGALDLNRKEGFCLAKPPSRPHKNTRRSGETHELGDSDDRTTERRTRQSPEQEN
ncbi:hypothetical protein Bca4012_076196 [Brassica carinata]